MEFKKLCEIFDQVKQTKGTKEKSNIIRQFFTICRNCHSANNIFNVLRLFVPKLDRERPSYNMKESKIARVLIKMLALPAGADKDVLCKSYLMSGQANDFGDVVYSVTRKYISNYKTNLTIDELNCSLDNIAKRSIESEAEDILMKLFKKCSPEDARWIIRIIIKDLKLGIDGNQILNCYHRDGKDYYSSNSSLKKVSEILYKQEVNIHELDIVIFEAFRPMLSKRVDVSVFKKELQENKLYYVENKFDGERFQLHMENNVFKYFSRNGFDYTDYFGSTFNEGIFTSKLRDCFLSSVQNIILDGEMMLWNKQTKKFGSQGMGLDVKKLKENKKYQPCFCIYDIIMLNEKILTNKTLKNRVNILKNIFRNIKTGTIIVSEIKDVYSRQEIVNELNLAVDKEEEGIVVKDPESIYKYSDRNSGWYKMKLEYFQDTMNDLDLILMGAQFASSTSDKLNSFIVGVRYNTDEGKPVYLSFGKVSSGLKDDELEMLDQKIKTEGNAFHDGHCTSLIFGKEKPNYFIEPENSLIFVVRATELIRTTDMSYRTSYTLRFPRVLKIRFDKSVDECLNMQELLELSNSNKPVIKMNKRHIDLEEIMQTKIRQVKKNKIIVPTFANSRKISDLLEDYTFYVFNGTNEKSKDNIETLLKKAGGRIHYKIDESVDIVLVGEYNDKAKTLSKIRKRYDVISINWLNRVIQDGNLLGYETEEIYCLGNNIKNCLSDEVDRYGDSYTKPATIESLMHSIEIMINLNEVPTFRQFVDIPNVKSFHKYVAYFDKYKTVGDPHSDKIYDSFKDEVEFRFYSGKVYDTIVAKTNLIIFNCDEARYQILKEYIDSVNRGDIEIRTNTFIYEKKI